MLNFVQQFDFATHYCYVPAMTIARPHYPNLCNKHNSTSISSAKQQMRGLNEIFIRDCIHYITVHNLSFQTFLFVNNWSNW